MSTAYLISSLAWSLIGFVLGRLTVNVEQIRRSMSTNDEELSAEQLPPSPRRRRLPVVHKLGAQQIVGMVVVIVALLSILLVAWQNVRLNQSISCQSRFNQVYEDALRASDEVAELALQDAKGLAISNKELWLGLLRNASSDPATPPTAAQRAASIATLNNFLVDVDAYVVSLEKVIQARVTFVVPDNKCVV